MHRLAALSCVSFTLLGCGFDYTPSDNLLPDPTGASSGSTDESTLDTETGAETGGEQTVPATYRIGCVDIKSMGDADETVFQVITLQNTWAADITNFKLNILIDLLTEDADAGMGSVTIRSGVGPNAANQCSQGDVESPEFPVGFAPMEATWAPGAGGDECAVPGTGDAVGTYTLEMGADERVFIYAEDNDGTVFNCSVDKSGPDAIPIWAVTATMSMTSNRGKLAGTLNGCVVQAQALAVCSCLGACGASAHPDCDGCPTGSVPLGLLLGGVNPTPNCSDLMGEPAFDIVLEFTANRLGDVPSTCG